MDLRFNVIPLDLNPSHYDAQGSYIFRKRRFSSLMHLPYVHAAATTPVQQLGVFLAHLTPPYQPSPIPLSGRPAHRPFRGLLGVHSHCGLHTRAVTVFCDRYPGASDISSPPCLPRLLPAGANRRVGLAPTGKRRLVTAHVESRHPHRITERARRLFRAAGRAFRSLPVRLSNGPIGTEKVIHLCRIFFQPFGRVLILEVLVEA